MFPCESCNRPVAKSHQSIQCDTCDKWVDPECNKINKHICKLIQNEKNTRWFCITVLRNFFSSPI